MNDVKRFVVLNMTIARDAPRQWSLSALVFALEKSLVKQKFKDQFPPWILRLPRTAPEWDAKLTAFDAPCGTLCQCEFSPDGRFLAMASVTPDEKQSNLQLVDVSTGIVRWDARVEGEPISIKISPDGRLMGFLSGDFSRRHKEDSYDDGGQRIRGRWIRAGEVRIGFWDMTMETVQQELICFHVEEE